MASERKREEAGAGTRSVDGDGTVINGSRVALIWRDPGRKRRVKTDQFHPKSGILTTKHRLAQRLGQIGNCKKRPACTRIYRTRILKRNLRIDSQHVNGGPQRPPNLRLHLLQGMKYPNFTNYLRWETQQSGLKTKIAACIHSIQRREKIYRGRYWTIHSVCTVSVNNHRNPTLTHRMGSVYCAQVVREQRKYTVYCIVSCTYSMLNKDKEKNKQNHSEVRRLLQIQTTVYLDCVVDMYQQCHDNILNIRMLSNTIAGHPIAKNTQTSPRKEPPYLRDRISESETNIRIGHLIWQPQLQRDGGLRLDAHAVVENEDQSRGFHDCAVRSLLQLARARQENTEAEAMEYVLKEAYDKGQEHVVAVLGKIKRNQPIEEPDRLTMTEMDAVLGPIIYAIQSEDGWKIYSTERHPSGERPGLRVQYATPILIVDEQQGHLTGGTLTVRLEHVTRLQGLGTAMQAVYLTGREDNYRYGMRRTIPIEPTTRSTDQNSYLSNGTQQYGATLSPDTVDDDKGGLEAPNPESGEWTLEAQQESKEHLATAEPKLDYQSPESIQVFVGHAGVGGLTNTPVILTTLFRAPVAGLPSMLAGTLSSAGATVPKAMVVKNRRHPENGAKCTGKSGGLTITATKALLKRPAIRAALADPLRTAEKVSRVIEAQEEAGLLFGIPYSQPATLSVASDGLCGIHALGQHARLLMQGGVPATPDHYQLPIAELVTALPRRLRQSRSEVTMAAYGQFLIATLALHQESSGQEQRRIRQLMGDRYESALADVQRLAQMVTDQRYSRTNAVIGPEHWQKSYVLSFLSAVNHVPLELYESYLAASGRLEARRLRLEQRYDGKATNLDVTMTAVQLTILLQRGMGGIGLVDNHFYLVGPLQHLSKEVQPAIYQLAEQLIHAEGMIEHQTSRNSTWPETKPGNATQKFLSAIKHSDDDAEQYGITVRTAVQPGGRSLFTTEHIPANRRITLMPGLSLNREMQDLIATATTGIERFQNVLCSWNGRAVDTEGMERYYYYGHLANTTMNQEICNSEYRWAATDQYPHIYSTKNIEAGAEIIVSYGSRAQMSLSPMHLERKRNLRHDGQKNITYDYTEEIVAMELEFLHGMATQEEAGSSKRAEEEIRGPDGRGFKGLQDGTGETEHLQLVEWTGGLGDSRPLAQLHLQPSGGRESGASAISMIQGSNTPNLHNSDKLNGPGEVMAPAWMTEVEYQTTPMFLWEAVLTPEAWIIVKDRSAKVARVVPTLPFVEWIKHDSNPSGRTRHSTHRDQALKGNADTAVDPEIVAYYRRHPHGRLDLVVATTGASGGKRVLQMQLVHGQLLTAGEMIAPAVGRLKKVPHNQLSRMKRMDLLQYHGQMYIDMTRVRQDTGYLMTGEARFGEAATANFARYAAALPDSLRGREDTLQCYWERTKQGEPYLAVAKDYRYAGAGGKQVVWVDHGRSYEHSIVPERGLEMTRNTEPRYEAGRQTDPAMILVTEQEEQEEWIGVPPHSGPEETNLVEFGIAAQSDLRIAAQNTRCGLMRVGNEHYRTAICGYIQRAAIDIMALLDIGVPPVNRDVIKRLWEHQLGPNYRVYVFPSGRPIAKASGRGTGLVGGQVIICYIDPARFTLLRCQGDSLDLGILVTTTVQVTGRSARLKVLSVYVPNMPATKEVIESSGGLYQKAQVALREAGAVTQEPITWLTGLLRAKVTEGKCKEHRPTVILGDFNRAPAENLALTGEAEGPLEQWLADIGVSQQWTNSIRSIDPQIYTYRSGTIRTFIDHCAHTMAPEELVWGAVDVSWNWAMYTDHLPIALGIRLGIGKRAGSDHSAPIRKRRGIRLQFNNDVRMAAATAAE